MQKKISCRFKQTFKVVYDFPGWMEKYLAEVTKHLLFKFIDFKR